MAFTNVSTADSAPGKPVTSEWAEKMVKNDSFLNGQLGSLGTINILNGSFEVNDTAVTGGAADWTVVPFTGGNATVSTVSGHGTQSMKFTHPGGFGNGGAAAESDKMPVSGDRDYVIKWSLRSTVALKNKVSIKSYSGGGVLISETTVFDSISTNSEFASTSVKFSPVSSARSIAVKLTGGATGTLLGGSAYFDGVEVSQQVKQDFIKSATGSVTINSTISSSGPTVVTMADFGFFPSIAASTGGGSGSSIISNVHMSPVTTASSTDNIGKFGLAKDAGGGATPNSYFINYRYITNSEGFKGAQFKDSSGDDISKYTLSNAPPNWEKIFDSMANSNGWTWEPTTERNT